MIGMEIFKRKLFSRYIGKWDWPLGEKDKWTWEKLWTKSASGGTIVGLYKRPVRNTAKATIILAHPLDRSAKGYFLYGDYVDALCQLGLNVVVFDFNGFGQSSFGDFDYMEDIIAIGEKAKEISPGKPLAFHGIGFGAFWGSVALNRQNNSYSFAILEDVPLTEQQYLIVNHLPKNWYRLAKSLKLLSNNEPNIRHSLVNAVNIEAILVNIDSIDNNPFKVLNEFINIDGPVQAAYFDEQTEIGKEERGRFINPAYISTISKFICDSIASIERKNEPKLNA
jgi:alpha/beta superfamily hydrolase